MRGSYSKSDNEARTVLEYSMTIRNRINALVERVFNFMLGEKTMANIYPTSNGFVLLDEKGIAVGTYSRRRDAVRGATRRGLNLA